MPISRTSNDFSDYADWESFEGDDDIYMGVETDLLDDWEDDGAIAQVRETPIEKPVKTTKPAAKKTPKKKTTTKKPTVEIQSNDAEVFSLVDHSNAKTKNDLVAISGPSEEELLEIESIGVENYIDNVLLDDSEPLDIDEVDPLVSDVIEDEISLSDIEDEEEDFGVKILTDEDDIKARILAYEDMENQVELNVKPIFVGLGCALVTLFDEDQEVEYKLTARLAKRLAESNTNAIFVGASEGEGQTLSAEEKIKLVSEIKKAVKTSANIVVDVSAPSIRQSVELTRECVKAGADSLMVEINSNTSDIYQLVDEIHKAAYEKPILIRFSSNANEIPIAPEFLYDLPIDGVIDATGDAAYLLHLTSAYSGPVYIGSTALLLMAHSLDIAGVVLPSIACDENLVKMAFEGDADAQHELAMIKRDYGVNEIEQIKKGLENTFLISPLMRN